jgi:hypothetical protein
MHIGLVDSDDLLPDQNGKNKENKDDQIQLFLNKHDLDILLFSQLLNNSCCDHDAHYVTVSDPQYL